MSDSKKQIICSFCGEEIKPGTQVLAGLNGYICENCVDACKEYLDSLEQAEHAEMGGKNRTAAVDQADQQPVPPGHFPGAHPFPDQHGQHHVQQRDPGHFQNHDQHRFYLINITYTGGFVQAPGFFCL